MNETTKEQGQELAPIPLPGAMDTDDIIASAERRLAHLQKIKTLAFKVTNENDWVDQDGRPYLVASGAEKIARLFGVSWENPKIEKIQSDDEKGPFYFYKATATFTLRNDRIESIGTCSQKDQFFGKRSIQEGDKRVSVFKPTSEIDETNIMKAAYTNCIGNGVTRILGLRNMTWDELSTSGIHKDKVARVTYAGGGAGGGKISEAQARRLFAITSKSGKTPEVLKAYLKENFKIESSSEIDRKDYEKICTWAEAE